MIDLGQYDAIKTAPNDNDGVFVRFRQRLLSLIEEDNAHEADTLRSSFTLTDKDIEP